MSHLDAGRYEPESFRTTRSTVETHPFVRVWAVPVRMVDTDLGHRRSVCNQDRPGRAVAGGGFWLRLSCGWQAARRDECAMTASGSRVTRNVLAGFDPGVRLVGLPGFDPGTFASRRRIGRQPATYPDT
jgi:hypothetical protein